MRSHETSVSISPWRAQERVRDLGTSWEEKSLSLFGSKDMFPAGNMGTFQGCLREGDLFSFALGKTALWWGVD